MFNFVSKQQTSRDLTDAALLLEEGGWTQRYFHDDKGYCVMGAINQVVTGSSFAPPALTSKHGKKRIDKAIDAIYDTIFAEKEPTIDLGQWNDMPTQEAGMVIATVRTAAERLSR
jgi:hypothetical protein